MLQKLEFLIALAREKHFGRAAESCGVAQPTLSLGIQELEQSFNAQLVRRSSRFHGLTPEGERVLVWALRMVGDAHAMRQEILGLQNGAAHIRVAAVPVAMPIVPSVTAPFQLRYPQSRFTVLTRSPDELIEVLHRRDIDVGVTYIDKVDDDVETVPLFRQHHYLLTARTGPFADEKDVPWTRLADASLCLLTRDVHQRRIVDDIMRRLGITVAPMVETDSVVALVAHVATGQWVTVVPRSLLSTIDVDGSLRAIPLVEPEVFHTIGLMVSKRFPVQPAINFLMQEVRTRPPYQMAALT